MIINLTNKATEQDILQALKKQAPKMTERDWREWGFDSLEAATSQMIEHLNEATTIHQLLECLKRFDWLDYPDEMAELLSCLWR